MSTNSCYNNRINVESLACLMYDFWSWNMLVRFVQKLALDLCAIIWISTSNQHRISMFRILNIEIYLLSSDALPYYHHHHHHFMGLLPNFFLSLLWICIWHNNKAQMDFLRQRRRISMWTRRNEMPFDGQNVSNIRIRCVRVVCAREQDWTINTPRELLAKKKKQHLSVAAPAVKSLGFILHASIGIHSIYIWGFSLRLTYGRIEGGNFF